MLHPVRQLILAANGLAAGERVTIPSVDRTDEIGQLAKSLLAWEQATAERLELAQAMIDVGARTDLDDLVALGLRKTAEALGAAQVVVSIDSGLVFFYNGGDHQRIDSPEGALLPDGSPAAHVSADGPAVDWRLARPSLGGCDPQLGRPKTSSALSSRSRLSAVESWWVR